MSEWWTYRPSDFLMFAPRAYYRLFELHNLQVWPAHLVALAVGIGVALVWWQRRWSAIAITLALFALVWGWVAVSFHARQLSQIHTAASWIAGAFGLQALLLLAGEAALAARRQTPLPTAGALVVGVGLLLFALLLQPWLAAAAGRPWTQAEVFGIAPDATVIGTLGLLAMATPLLPRWLGCSLWVVPLVWCAVASVTLWTMGSVQAVLMPAAAALALLAARAGRQRQPRGAT